VLVGHRRLLWWPISSRPVSFASGEVGLSITSQVLVFGGSLLALLMVRWIWHLRSDRSGQESERIADQGSRSWQRVWVTGGITALLLLAVAATQYLRDVRERQLDLAWTMISRKQGASALDVLDQAERWPSTARPGRIDYARAEAYADMGQRAKAEQYYLRSYRADPSCFWTVADLAVFYASSDEPLEVRRRRAAPYLSRLTGEFANEAGLPRCLAKLERRLSSSPVRQVSRTE
jgi:tetratricopeptide (TPR) repeat protein